MSVNECPLPTARTPAPRPTASASSSSDAGCENSAGAQRWSPAQLAQRIAEGALRVVAVHSEHDPLDGPGVLARGLDHDPGRLLDREVADARPEGHQPDRPRAELLGLRERRARGP